MVYSSNEIKINYQNSEDQKNTIQFSLAFASELS